MTTHDTWDPQQYDKFERQREQPFFDLLDLVRVTPGMHVVDLGCGTGKLTRTMHERLQARQTLGVDRSEAMLNAVRVVPPSGGLRFEVGTIESFAERRLAPDERPNLIFSNAALHWIEDHDTLIPRLAAMLAPDGQLAFQVPAQHHHLTHLTAAALAAEEPYRSALGSWRKPEPVLAPEDYARVMYRSGFIDPIVRLVVYPHLLASRDDVVDWVKGTTLTEYARKLPAGLYGRFVDDYRARLLPQLEATQPYFFPFKRILCWGQRSA
jgi:trans-aconitate 2-methyltransferase